MTETVPIDECYRWIIKCAHCNARCKSTSDAALHFITKHLFNVYKDKLVSCTLCNDGEGIAHVKIAHPNVCVFCMVDASMTEHDTCQDVVAGALGKFGIAMLGDFFKSRAKREN